MSPMRLAFLADDFTGATDALEVLHVAGLRCALFLAVPDAATLSRLGPFDAIGIAIDSRAMTPAEMRAQLPPLLHALAALPAPWVHYKVCSTFDSAPQVGSIGTLMELAREAFGDAPIPIVAATPALGRYCVFGQLFARSGTDGQVHRIDRHPVMAQHPVTPMGEADLVRHLGAQTSLRINKLTLPHFAGRREALDAEVDRLLAASPAALLCDGSEPGHLTELGRQLERLAARSDRARFAVGSSGLEYALTQWWHESGPSPAAPPPGRVEPVDRVLAVSGSASPLSALQIDAALAAGFIDLPVDARALVAGDDSHAARQALVDAACAALDAGRSVMLHTARGPQDPRIDSMLSALQADGLTREQARHEGGRRLGQRLGEVVDAVLRRVALPRLLLSGGDTSSLITQALAPQALRIEARLAPGAPLCRFVGGAAHVAGLQVALKGGQMGGPDYFVRAWRGPSGVTHS
jgi:uncharacterized protein YgbK (DUF1537 family)